MTNITLERLVNEASNGSRIRLEGRTVWAGLGNRAGLHSFADELLRKKFAAGEARLRRALAAGGRFEVLEFHNITRDRGRWCLVSGGTLRVGRRTT